jgi:hypothetical protein
MLFTIYPIVFQQRRGWNSGVGQAGMGLSGGLLAKAGALAMAGVSPAFVTFLLFKVCGVEVVDQDQC